VLEAGAQARFCASLLQPSETLVMTVSLVSGQKSITLLKKTSSRAFHDCTQFKVSSRVRLLFTWLFPKTFPMTFVQTDKPLYLPGQTGNLRLIFNDVITPNPYDIIEIEDASGNRIGQWLNETSTRKIVQLSYTLSSEAREGIYQIIVTIGEDKVYHTDEVSVAQEYTFGQPVPGSVKVEMCRPSQPYFANIRLAKPAFPPGVPDVTPPCSKETKQVNFDIFTWVSYSWFIVPVTQGQVSFKLNVSPEMVPLVQVVAYAVLPSETVIASSADFSTEKCFTHKVSLEFTPSSAVPGEQVTMTLTAEPHSLCGVSAVDRSVFIKEPGKSLDIFSLLPVVTGSYIPYEVQDSTECFNVRAKRSRFFPYPGPDASDDAFTVFQNVGLKMVTNLLIQIPSCLRFKGREYQQGAVTYRLFTIVTVRTFFPETWIWELVDVGLCGIVDIPLTVPDTITTWETEVFCLSLVGFGLAPRTTLTVFQPFFLELTLPYSVIRGERFELKATTFSYLTSCIMVTVTPAPSLDYTLTPLSGGQYTFCLCGSERKTVSWTMTPSTLGTVTVSVTAGAVASQASCGNEIVSVPERGRIDVVTKSLIVKAEGIKVIKTYNWLLCPKETLTEELQIQLPTDVIPGSVRVLVSVLGDILGRALKNLDGLLKMPSGCGEQNAAALASDIYILEYLTVTQQLTQAIKEKATTFLISGYQRQLNYKHADGAYSAFLTVAGNTWLTAFVVRCFTKAQSFIYIDPQKIEESKTWLLQQQRQTGCFVMSGELFHNDMKGGVSDEVTLSAYITAVFLEMKMPVSDPVMNKSLSCLKQSVSNLNNTYTTALLAYVFTLAGDMETRAQLLQHLDTVAIRQGGFLYWSQTSTETSASLSVEISSYVLLAKLSASPTDEDLGYASFIVRWLTSQQNHYGGFSSTQTLYPCHSFLLYSDFSFSGLEINGFQKGFWVKSYWIWELVDVGCVSVANGLACKYTLHV
uniref:Alpha-2-macroglobulin-like 1 n=1 Tax=Mastacembelus armatus TaxID=205130 RepID=A0A3Q3LRP5_9TELE